MSRFQDEVSEMLDEAGIEYERDASAADDDWYDEMTRQYEEQNRPDYEPAPEVEEVARELIAEHHGRLASASIGYMFRNTENWTSQGNSIAGKAYRVGGWQRTATGWDFLIMIHGPTWRNTGENAHRALVDHELCHCCKNEHGNWALQGHDFEDFLEIVKRHGAYRVPLQQLQQELHQLSVFEGGRR